MTNTAMVIDDSAFQRFLTETVIKKNLFAEQLISYDSAMSALACLKSLEKHHEKFPDVIFLDIHMPQMDGFGFLDRYMEFPENIRQQCKIVMLSSTDAAEDHRKMKTYPVIRKFLSKPLSDEKLNDLNIC